MKRKRGFKRPTSKDRLAPFYKGESGILKYLTTSWTFIPIPNEETALVEFREGRSLAATGIAPWQGYGFEEITCTNRGKTEFNNCTHRKTRGVNLPFLLCWKLYNQNRYTKVKYYRKVTSRPLNPISCATKLRSIEELAKPGDNQGFSARAFWSMRPKFEGEVSLINSVFELKDFRDVLKPRQIMRSFRSSTSIDLFSKTRRNFAKLAKRSNINASIKEKGIKNYAGISAGTSGLISSVTGTGAAAVLTMNLAIKPTIADALGIIAQARSTAFENQQIFKLYGEAGSSSHFTEYDKLSHQLTLGTLNNYVYGEGTSYSIKRTATMRSLYEYKMRSHNQALDRFWGLSGSTEALWNMLPLSFVLDYWFTVGKVLGYMERDNNVELLSTQYCESVKITYTDGLHVVQGPFVGALVVDGLYKQPSKTARPHLISGVVSTSYKRQVMEPYKGPAFPRFRKPSSTQAANMLALVRVIMM